MSGERRTASNGATLCGGSVLAALCLLVALLAVACQPLQRYGASLIAGAPNQGAPGPAAIEGEIRVAVGPPSAILSVEILDAREPRGTVFVLHGIRADRRSVRAWGRLLAEAGFRAVLVDLRGHGRSTGDWLSYGVVEARDLAQVLDALDASGQRIGAVGVMGLSYGAAVAIEWAGSDPRIKAVVAVAPFASLRTVAPGYTLIPLPEGFLNGAIDLAGQEGGFDPDQASPVVAIARTRAHVLLIHGENDNRIPAWHSRLIFAAGRDHAELVLVPSAGHRSIGGDPIVLDRAPAWFARYLLP
jgi:pimeloyl-ACP methyl ester carboxylesterase